MDQAIEMLKERKFPLPDARCMVIGNGEMGKLAAQSLKPDRCGCDGYRPAVPKRCGDDPNGMFQNQLRRTSQFSSGL